MGLTSAMNTSLNGLALNETSIDVIGNNIANAGTNGFKSSNVLFATQLSRTISVGSQPTPVNAGTNPQQIGLGAQVAAISKDFTSGSITNSTSPSDLAIQGDGFFVVETGIGNAYTRDGNFTLSAPTINPNTGAVIPSRLETAQGYVVQGYGVDANFNLVTTQLTDIEIPLGSLNVAQQTQNITVGGALSPSGDVGTQGALLLSSALTDTSGGDASTDPADASTLLTSVFLDGDATALFTSGQTVSFTAQKGGRLQPPQTLAVDGATTMQDLLDLMANTIGIHSGGDIQDDPNSGGQPGVTMTAGGEIQIVGNRGTINDVAISPGDLLQNGASVPIAFAKSESADGESAVTDFIVYDSLGAEVAVKMTSVLDSVTGNSTTYRYFIESVDDSDADVVVSNGTLTFDTNGNVVSGGTATFLIDRNATAAASPMQITADLSTISGIVSPNTGSTLNLLSQDGSGPGTLTEFNVTTTGEINGIFDNGVSRILGQVALAKFANNQGLLEAGDNLFREGVSSGPALIGAPGTQGVGTILPGAVELSNTDIGRNLVDLIVASTNYRGNARVISSVNDLINELLLLGR
jgi:flagellar hook protein FlgE